MHAIREEIAGIRNKNDETTLDLRHSSHKRILKTQSSSDTNNDADQHTTKENEEEETHSLEDIQETQRACLTFRVLLRRLEQNDSNSIVKDRLAENNGIKLRLNLVQVENRQDSDRVGSG